MPNPTQAALAVATLGTGMIYLDQSALNLALPAIQRSFQLDLTDLQWINNIYYLILASLLLLGGIMADRYGRVRIYIIGMLLFGLGSLLAGISPNGHEMLTPRSMEVANADFHSNTNLLLAARSIQGLGGALMVPVGLALLNANSPPAQRGKLIGLWGSLTASIISLGPILSGLLVDNLSWRGVFFINVPLAILGIYLAQRFVPESYGANAKQRLNWFSAALLLVSLGTLTFGLIEGTRFGWTSALILSCFAFSILGMTWFIRRQYQVANPLIPPFVFSQQRFLSINLVTLLHWTSIGAVFFLMPLYLQLVLGYSATQAGLTVTPISLMVMLMSRFAGDWADRFGETRLTMLGMALGLLAMLGFSTLQESVNYAWHLMPLVLLFGLGLGIMIAPLTRTAMTSLPDEYSGITSGVNNAASRIAHMLAVALAGSLLASYFQSQISQRLAETDIPVQLHEKILGISQNINAMELAEDLNPQQLETLQSLLNQSWMGGFQWVMLAGVGITLLAIGVLWWGLKTD